MNKSTFALVASLVAVVTAASGFFLKPQVQNSFGSTSGPTKTDAQEFLGGHTFGLVNSTSTTDTTYTMVAADIASTRQGTFYDTYIHMKTGSVATTTVTLPATSTLSFVLPRAGMRQSICFSVATSTGGAGLIIAKGTGWNIVAASSTAAGVTGPGSRTVNGGVDSCGWIVRERAVSSSPGFTDSTSTNPGNLTLFLTEGTPAQ